MSSSDQKRRQRESSRRYRERNRELLRARDREAAAKRRAADPERERQRQRAWREANPELSRKISQESGRRYREKDPERYRAMQREASSRWRAANPERSQAAKTRHILKSYGLTLEAYDAFVAAQGGGCAICGATSSGRKGDGRLLIDHCHATGVVRGLLCHQCNSMLGNAKDSPARLRAAAEYLERLSICPTRDQG